MLPSYAYKFCHVIAHMCNYGHRISFIAEKKILKVFDGPLS